MPTRTIPYVKVLIHGLCLAPVFFLYWWFRSGALAANADPVNYITHFTGNWALWTLLACLMVTPLRRMHPVLSNLIRLRRLIGLYAFFYATLHLATYVFLYSGYDLVAALTALRAGHPGELVIQWRLVWPSMVDDALKRRFIQVGLVGWGILLALAATSPILMLRWMGGKNWQRLHRLIYVSAILGCIHYWWIVKAGVRSPLPDTLGLAIVLLARVIWVMMKRRRKPAVAPKRAWPQPGDTI